MTPVYAFIFVSDLYAAGYVINEIRLLSAAVGKTHGPHADVYERIRTFIVFSSPVKSNRPSSVEKEQLFKYVPPKKKNYTNNFLSFKNVSKYVDFRKPQDFRAPRRKVPEFRFRV